MLQTRFDRWLRERFVYETHIYSMRPASHVPRRISTEELPEAPDRQYRIRYIARRTSDAEALIAYLKADQQMFATRVLDRRAWYVGFLAPQGKSFTLSLFWTTSAIGFVVSAAYGLTLAWENDSFRKQVLETLEILKG